MRVRLALIGVLGNGHDVHAIADHRVRHIEVFHELGKPRLKIQPVVQDQVSLGGFSDVTRRWLVAVDLGAGLGNGLHAQFVAGNVLGDVCQHGESCEHHGPVIISS